MIRIDPKSGQPIYEQIIEQYKLMILQDNLHSGDSIQSVRRLALELGITPGTVAKAYQEMERLGMIETIRGKGTFIAENLDVEPTKGDMAMVEEKLKKLIVECRYLGMDKEDILELVARLIGSFDKEEK